MAVVAATTIIASSISWMCADRKNSKQRVKQQKVALETWEGEGGMVVPDPDEESAVVKA